MYNYDVPEHNSVPDDGQEVSSHWQIFLFPIFVLFLANRKCKIHNDTDHDQNMVDRMVTDDTDSTIQLQILCQMQHCIHIAIRHFQEGIHMLHRLGCHDFRIAVRCAPETYQSYYLRIYPS
ncbi:hypothetical protein T4A_5806 [Trichinella pseudospiralis]|uniref:Uncharacterized protein n=1 Tax=Trichinella pseudospiralis TaxID=6337 RepID=A0A0V1ENG7_TRIPS|nr:hypothetical protein T4A_5806 [Trichinella pseudospiralis]